MLHCKGELTAYAATTQIEHGIVDRNRRQSGNHGNKFAAAGPDDQHKHSNNDKEGDDIGKHDGFHAHRGGGADQNPVAYVETGRRGNNIDKFLLTLMSRAAALCHTGFTS